jgi:hypothetical protein
MRKIILICFALIIGLIAFGQPIVNRAGASNTVSDARWQAQLNAFLPRYNDTTAANISKGIDSCGAIIYTRNPQAFWRRDCNPKRWTRLIDEGNIGNFIDSGSVSNISILNDSTLLICTASGVCDTINITTNITNISSVSFINDSSVQVCSTDTTTAVTVCDTIIIGNRQIVYFFQNGLRNVGSNIIELGDNSDVPNGGLQGAGMIRHNTTLDLLYSKLTIPQATVYDYGVQFRKYPGFGFQNGTGLTSWLHENRNDAPNTVRLGVNFTDSVYEQTPSYLQGYMGNTHAGYWIGTNLTGLEVMG